MFSTSLGRMFSFARGTSRMTITPQLIRKLSHRLVRKVTSDVMNLAANRFLNWNGLQGYETRNKSLREWGL